MRRRRERFFRWYRALPIFAMLIACIFTFVGNEDPAFLRQWLLPVHHLDVIEQASSDYGVDPYLACAVIKCESNWNDQATSSAGAVGLMQMMPSTAQEVARLGLVDSSRYSPDDLRDPETSIVYGIAYLSYLQKSLSSTDEVIAAYNAGLSQVNEWTSDGSAVSEAIEYPETAIYLSRVKDAYARYKDAYADGLVETT